ncbi:MAG: hypothetical protein COZ18_03890 [Flexibacter sp. CG_4_10_14_3_um_filter_32_15]|nr:MAG: hypothetical protein COZ18_03890 [Flexibacter sp. CG_4_10_14_3_um_filter_32_15]
MFCSTLSNISLALLFFLHLFFANSLYADDDLKAKELTKFQKDSIYISTEVEKAQKLSYSKPDSAEIIIHKMIAYSSKENSDFGKMSGYLTLGIIKFNRQDLEQSKDYFEKALKLAEKLEDESTKADILNGFGSYYLKKNNLDKAIDYYLLSLRKKEKQKNSELGASYINMGIVYKRLKNYEEAESYFKKAISAYSKTPQITKLYSYLNLAELYQDLENYEMNLSISDTIYRLATEVGMKNGIGASFTYKSASLSKFGKYEEALINIDSALFYFPANTAQQHKVLLDKAELLIHLKKYSQAESILLEVLPFLEDSWNNKSQALLHLSSVYKNKKQFEKSLDYFEQHKIANDTLKSREQRKEVANLLVKYETQEKEESIKKLNQEALIKDLELKNSYYLTIGAVVLGVVILIAVWIFFRQKNIIDTFEKEQAKLRWRRAQINPHFFFNVLSAIQMLVLEGEKQKVSKYITGFSYLMRQVLEGSNQEKVSVEDEIKFIKTYLDLEKLSLDFEYEINCNPKDLEIEDIFIPVMLLQPFIENAVEHGLRKSTKEDKKLDILFTEINQNTLKISIKDNGAGRNNKRKSNHISRALEITKDRQKLMKDAFEYEIIDLVSQDEDENQNALGTEIIFTIKI